MNMKNQIKLLQTELYNNSQILKELTHWFKVFNRPNGWHYDLDHIWILNNLEDLGIKPGATIIDAGAGQGIMQYFLASKGYNVISLDFSPRTKPNRANGIFNVVGSGDNEINYIHPYMNFIHYGDGSPKSIINRISFKKLKKIPQLPKRYFLKLVSLYTYLNERFFRKHDSFGTITYVRAPFHKVPLESNIADAVISVSAIEHADISLFDQNITELSRLLKFNAPLLITTSVNNSNETTYNKVVSGYCFSILDLDKYFPNSETFFDYENSEKNILNSNIFWKRLDAYYYNDENSFVYKKKCVSLPYLPVGIIKFKS